jgi:hypothetical protein
MKPYGLTVSQYENDSKKNGDLFGWWPWHCRHSHNHTRFSATGVKNALRRYKKAARRNGKDACNEE